MILLETEHLSHAYGHQPILHDLSVQFQQGETVAILGRSGCGKSTFARLLIGLEKPTEGVMRWRGHDLIGLTTTHRKEFLREVQLVFQDTISAVNPRKTVFEIISEPARYLLGQFHRQELLGTITNLLEKIGLPSSIMEHHPIQLSGGQLQRICLARALIVQPKLIILDEALSSLDVALQAKIIVLLKQLQQQFHTCYLFITHDLRLVERLCQKIIVMDNGQIVEQTPVTPSFSLLSAPGKALQNAILPAYPQSLMELLYHSKASYNVTH